MTWVLPVPVEVFQPRSVRLSPLVTGVPQFGHIPPEFRGHSPVTRAYWRVPLPGFSRRFIWSRRWHRPCLNYTGWLFSCKTAVAML